MKRHIYVGVLGCTYHWSGIRDRLRLHSGRNCFTVSLHILTHTSRRLCIFIFWTVDRGTSAPQKKMIRRARAITASSQFPFSSKARNQCSFGCNLCSASARRPVHLSWKQNISACVHISAITVTEVKARNSLSIVHIITCCNSYIGFGCCITLWWIKCLFRGSDVVRPLQLLTLYFRGGSS